jgi:predicted esterase
MWELHLEVLRTARVAVLGGHEALRDAGLPERGAEEVPGSTWFALHGYRQLARRFLRRFRSVAGPTRRVVAPEALSRFYLAPGDRPHGASDPVGGSWMTREDREVEIRDYVRYLDRVARRLSGPDSDGRGGTRTVLGFSQGAHTAARWAVLGSVRPDRLVLWGAGFPRDVPEAARERLEGMEVILVRGEEDNLRQREEEDREEALLGGWGIEWREIRHPGGHRIEPSVLDELARMEGRRAS